MKPQNLVLYVDGASRGNPGPASCGVCIQDENGATVQEFGECLGVQTNNFAEYRALERGLQECVLMRAKSVQVYTDSQLLAHQFNGVYKIKHQESKDSMLRIKELCREIGTVKVTHILRSTHPGNVRADKLANIALDEQAQARVSAKPVKKEKFFVQDSFF